MGVWDWEITGRLTIPPGGKRGRVKGRASLQVGEDQLAVGIKVTTNFHPALGQELISRIFVEVVARTRLT